LSIVDILYLPDYPLGNYSSFEFLGTDKPVGADFEEKRVGLNSDVIFNPPLHFYYTNVEIDIISRLIA